jgi:hypothetical protein
VETLEDRRVVRGSAGYVLGAGLLCPRVLRAGVLCAVLQWADMLWARLFWPQLLCSRLRGRVVLFTGVFAASVLAAVRLRRFRARRGLAVLRPRPDARRSFDDACVLRAAGPRHLHGPSDPGGGRHCLVDALAC